MKEKENKRAVLLRRNGFSLNEISRKLRISKSTASVWLKDVEIDSAGNSRLNSRRTNGRNKSWIARNKLKTKLFNSTAQKNVRILLKATHLKNIDKIYCSLLYWCEGNKDNFSVRFTNSDPKMIKTFLSLFRKSFNIDEKRLRVCLHLHDYHNEEDQKEFWSSVTNISKIQFLKTYRKYHTGIRIKEGYQGCVSLRYNDSKIARELNHLWQLFAEKYVGD